MADTEDELFRATLAAVAPGTELRDGLERILRGKTGALVVLGYDALVDSISGGGPSSRWEARVRRCCRVRPWAPSAPSPAGWT